MQGLLPSKPDSAACTPCVAGDAPGRRSRSGLKWVYPNGSGWQAKASIDGKLVIFGTGDTPEQAAALLPASLRSKSTACVARGVKRKAPLTPVELCDHVAQGSEEGSLSAELNALEKKNPYRPPPLSPACSSVRRGTAWR